ncbi:monovalent cation/H+ antiporter complex subunit F [Halomonas elongata]|uniref:Monovalent cation/H+ antiporter complex subunit F n=2 Tax=Halomonas elongata TaxID=2746 RepID=E1V713_HALED|nr:monovalent cation/H+ antiporter complex subunit F [Halomonas elongata]MBW5799523.1 pH regulation protein F [Halomonas elongata]MDL4863309.1 monovalent cation/H+ antiporter complex subunit F [Halomonas elongata]OBX34183.1 Na(+)/H(+) antiporter subunit F [Halomonas elongata]RAW09046.1 pH regulation protein F [Halomonas elongata]WBF17140.1 monovalent cation/H+ antiporter complex subunit F [Halomonas elongata]
MSTVILISLAVMALALCLTFIRLFRGPSLPDRVVAMELFSSILVGIIGVVAIAADEALLLDVAIVVALMGFMATIGFARFLERGGRRDD